MSLARIAEAQARYGEAETLTARAFQRWREAMNELVLFERHLVGAELTEAGVRKRQQLVRAIKEAEKHFRAAEDVETGGMDRKSTRRD